MHIRSLMRSLALALLVVGFASAPIKARSQVQYPVITPDNVEKLTQVGQLGYGGVNTHALSPDGKHLAVGTQNGVLLFDPTDNTAIPQLLPSPAKDVTQIAYSAHSDFLAFSDGSGTLYIWSAASGKITSKPGTSTNEIARIVFHPSEPIVAVAYDYEGVVRVWNLETDEKLAELKIQDKTSMTGLAFTNGGSRLMALGGTVLVGWDDYRETSRETFNISAAIKDIAFNPQNDIQRAFAFFGTPGFSDLVTQQGTETHELKYQGSAGYPVSVAFSPDGKLLAEGWNHKSAYIRDATTGDVKFELKHTAGFNRVEFTADGTQLWTSSYDGLIDEWNVQTGELAKEFATTPLTLTGLAFSPDGTQLAGCGYESNLIFIWDAVTQQEIARLDDGRDNKSIAFSADGRFFATGGAGDFSVHLWDAVSHKLLNTLKYHQNYVESVAFSADGKWLVSASQDNSVRVWDTASGKEVYTITGFDPSPESVIFTPDNTTLIVSAGDKLIRLYNAADGKFMDKVSFDPLLPMTLAVTADTSRLAMADFSTAQTANLTSKTKVKPIPAFVSVRGQRAVFNPEGSLLAAALDFPREVTFVNLTQQNFGKELGTVKRQASPQSVVFSPNGTLLAVAEDNGAIVLFGVAEH